MNMEEALANPAIHQKILAKEISEPPLLDDILNFVNIIIDWDDPPSFTVGAMEKPKVSFVPPHRPTTVNYTCL